MCGIAGIVMRKGERPDDAVLDRLTQAMAHRGPDGHGRFVGEDTALINTRLAIIDLKTGDQPFETPNGTVLVANGEIYNDPEIRAGLKDISFRSGSDCEPPVYLYERKGLDYADDLRGMYAIAIYDKANARLVLTRDPFGIKQLYYVSTDRYFAFASEPRALIEAGLADNEIEQRRCAELLQLKFTTGDETVFSKIDRLLPGETIVVSKGRIIERRRRRALPWLGPVAQGERDSLAQFDAILMESVKAHIRSDVPYGLFLSGGIDSCTLLSAMMRLTTNPVIAFTATFPDSGAADESEAARHVARAAGAEHHIVELTREDFWNSAPRVVAALDDPTTDAAALPTYKLAAAARAAGVKVVLSGEGADEIFGGYSRYRRAVWLFGMLGRKSRKHGVLEKFRDPKSDRIFEAWRTGLEAAERAEIYPGWSAAQALQAVDCAEWLPNDLLVKLDRCLMANSVEGRTPFLDPIVGPYGFGLPDRLKVKGKFGKWLVREWLSKHLPEAGAFARKTGFNPPIGEWIESYRTDLMPLLLAQPGLANLCSDSLIRKAMSAPKENSQAAWSIVFYALWHSHHVLGVPADGSIADVLATAAKHG